eukprot:Sspe_Gene.72547::Locus_43360_Transcript_1_1_Confidence_1.000_Length_365::g.72547::m.72547
MWNIVEPLQGVKLGETVYVKSSLKDPWVGGKVEGFGDTTPVVTIDGGTEGVTYPRVEGVGESVLLGEKVRVKNGANDGWKRGVVTKLDSTNPIVEVDGVASPAEYNIVEPLKGLKAGDRVR